MIRVLLLAEARPNRLVEPQWELLARYVPRQECELHLCLLGPTDPEHRPDGFASISYVRQRSSPDGHALWKLRRLIHQLRPDLVHAWTTENLGWTAPLVRLSGTRQLVVSVAPDCEWPGWRLPLPALLLPEVNWIASGPMAEQALRNSKPRGQVRTILPAAEPAKRVSIDRVELCRRINVPPNARLVVAAGDTRPYERMQDIVWAGDLIQCVRNDFKLLVVAQGLFRRPLERFAEQCQLADTFRFVQPDIGLPAVLQHAEGFLTASMRPATELILSAMAAGVPVIASDLEDHRSIITSGTTGFLVQPRDRAGFARTTVKLLDNALLRESMGAASRTVIRESYDPSRMAAEYGKLYLELSVQHTGPRRTSVMLEPGQPGKALTTRQESIRKKAV